MNLLMVNDEKLTVDMMKNGILWKEYGIDEVYTAYDVEEGKACMEEHPVDILLCDIEMPGENGIALLRWVRKEKKNVECIFLTCHASFEYAQEAITLGCQDYLLIPAKYEDIGQAVLKVVKRILQRREEERYQEMGKQAVQKQMESAIVIHGEKQKPEELVACVTRYIAENLGDELLSVNSVADRMFLHPVYMNRIFKKEKGISVGQYIISERMKLASVLLLEGKLSANAVAEQVGYKSYSNFSLAFKKAFDCSPTQYLKKSLLL